MKKYKLVLFVLAFVFGLFNVSANFVSATNCASGDLFNTATGQACGTTNVSACNVGDLFSSVTGQRCPTGDGYAGISGGATLVGTFNNLLCGYKTVGSIDATKALQQFLKVQGYYYAKVDGKYGAISARSVSDFQSDNNISTSCSGSNPSSVTGIPVITSISPTSGPVGTTVTLTGSGFGSASMVDITGGDSKGGPNPIFVSSSVFRFVIPNDLDAGIYNIRIVGSQSQTHGTLPTSNTVSFTVNAPTTRQAPHINAVTPFLDINGTQQFSVTGTGFLGSYPYVDGQGATYDGSSLTDTSVTLISVKQLGIAGIHTVYLVNSTGQSNTVTFQSGNSTSQIPVIDYVGSKDTVSGLNGYIISGSNHNDINGHNILSVNRAFLRTSISDASKIYNLPYTINNSDEGMSFTVPNTVPLGSYYLFLGSSAGISLPFPVTVVAGN